jgi:hypothetical protein
VNSIPSTWDITPRRALGPIQLGSRLDDVQSLLGSGESFTKIVGSPPALMYLELGVAAYFDSTGRLTELEAFEPSVVTLSGVKLLGSSLDAILGELQEAARTFRRDADGAESSQLGVRLWAPDHLVVSVVVFDPQNPSRFRRLTNFWRRLESLRFPGISADRVRPRSPRPIDRAGSVSRFVCPCCGNLTLNSPSPGSFEICPVCHWEDDNVQYIDPEYPYGANGISLEEARRNYQNFGAILDRWVAAVRNPLPNEIPRGFSNGC